MQGRSASARRSAPSVENAAVSIVNAIITVELLESRRLMSMSLPKIGQALEYLANDFSTRPAATQSRAVIRNKPYTLASGQPNGRLIETVGDTVKIKVVPNDKGGKKLVSQLQGLGATVTSGLGVIMTAAVPVSALAKVNGLSALLYADTYIAPKTNAGKTDDLGVQSMNADVASKQYGVDGTGVRVGILSDSYGYTTTPTSAAQDVASGDLPAAGVTVVKDDNSTTNPNGDFTNYPPADEGRAMAQIVHDVAPGAAISFYTADVSESDFAAGITTLAKPASQGGQGAQVVVDDVAYYDEPFFQDGVVAQAVNNAYTNYGTSYFSAAGNEARQSYESSFNGFSTTVSAISSTAYTYEDFDPSSTATSPYQQITVPAGGEFFIMYQWDSPFASASQAAGNSSSSGKSQNSVSLYLLNAAKTGLATTASGGSVTGTSNRVNGDAYQYLDFINPSSTASVTINLVARVASGSAPGYIKYIDEGGGNTIQYATNSGTTVGHADAANAMGVGAAWYYQTPSFNTNPALKESFSSAGGTPIFFNPNGTKLSTTAYRQAPGIVAPDGAATTFFYGSVETTGGSKDNQYHFYGTSAAAPHAAAVAALMLQAKPTLTNAQVYSTLESTAADMSTAGFDYDTGYGLVQADKALAAISASSISGTVYRDINNNGVKDGSDYAVAGQTVYLDSNTNGAVDSGTTTLSNTTATAIADSTASTSAVTRTTSSITSSLAGRVTNVTLTVNITHSRASDLGLALITPSGVRIPLLTTLGGISSSAGTGFNLTLNDAASSYIETTYSTGVLTGTFKPETKLAAAINESAAGTWKLEVGDYKSGSTGTLNSWSITLGYADPSALTDSNGNYTFTGLTPSAFYGAYHVRTTAPSGFVLSGTTAYDYTLARSTTTTGANFGDYAPISTVANIVLDDGTAQRSRIRGATVTFNGTIPQANIASGAFILTQTSGTIDSYTANVTSVSSSAGQTTVQLSFAGNSVIGGSVADGNYSLAIDGSKIVDTTGLAVDAAGTGTPGSSMAYSFYRLYGDINGDRTVNSVDNFQFRNAFGSATGDANYNAALDYDGDGKVNSIDNFQFRARFLTTI